MKIRGKTLGTVSTTESTQLTLFDPVPFEAVVPQEGTGPSRDDVMWVLDHGMNIDDEVVRAWLDAAVEYLKKCPHVGCAYCFTIER